EEWSLGTGAFRVVDHLRLTGRPLSPDRVVENPQAVDEWSSELEDGIQAAPPAAQEVGFGSPIDHSCITLARTRPQPTPSRGRRPGRASKIASSKLPPPRW